MRAPQAGGPVATRADVHADEAFLRGGGDGKGVPLGSAQLRAVQVQVLPGLEPARVTDQRGANIKKPCTIMHCTVIAVRCVRLEERCGQRGTPSRVGL
eukprot:6956122-Pyramimonas_sp.AAC.1